MKPYDTPIGEPVRTMVMSEKFYKETPHHRRQVHELLRAGDQDCSSTTRPVAEKYVREVDLQEPDHQADDFDDAISNSPYTYDVTPSTSRSPPT
jgi:NitT/TauT family transport system substrate-binding protein